MDNSNLENYMKRCYIETNKLSFPGLNVDKIIQNDLLDLPEGFSSMLQAKKEIESVIEQILKTSFQFPVSMLFVTEQNDFSLTDEFKSELAKSTEPMTESQVQNDVVEAVERFTEVVNDLIELRIVRNDGNMWYSVGETLALVIENTKGSARPLHPSRKMFKRNPLNKFSTKNIFVVPDKSGSDIVG